MGASGAFGGLQGPGGGPRGPAGSRRPSGRPGRRSMMPLCCTVKVELQKYHICKIMRTKTLKLLRFPAVLRTDLFLSVVFFCFVRFMTFDFGLRLHAVAAFIYVQKRPEFSPKRVDDDDDDDDEASVVPGWREGCWLLTGRMSQ